MADPHFGPRVIGEEAFRRQRATTSVAAHHFGGRVVAPPEEEVPGAGPNLHALNWQSAVEEVQKVTAPAELRALHEMERAHPKYAGGRRTVLDAIEEALGEAGVPEPSRPAVIGAEEEGD